MKAHKYPVGSLLLSVAEKHLGYIQATDESFYGYKYKISLIRKQHGTAELHYGFQELRLLTQPPYNYKYCPVVK